MPDEKLQPLGDPAKYPDSARYDKPWTAGIAPPWTTWNVPSHLERIYQRLDDLLGDITFLHGKLLAEGIFEKLVDNQRLAARVKELEEWQRRTIQARKIAMDVTPAPESAAPSDDASTSPGKEPPPQ